MKQCTWITLLPEFISGREGDEGESQEDSEGKSKDESGKPEGDTGSGSKDQSGKTDDEGEEDVSGLKTALEKERANVKARDKELAKLKKRDEDADLAKKDEVEQANIKAQRAEEKATKLAAGLRRTSLNSAIEKAAEKLGFIDTDDAIAGVEVPDDAIEQDEDDPSDITIDSAAVLKAVKALATKKPHFIKSGTEDGDATGNQFGGNNRKPKKTSDETLREKYQALQNH